MCCSSISRVCVESLGVHNLYVVSFVHSSSLFLAVYDSTPCRNDDEDEGVVLAPCSSLFLLLLASCTSTSFWSGVSGSVDLLVVVVVVVVVVVLEMRMVIISSNLHTHTHTHIHKYTHTLTSLPFTRLIFHHPHLLQHTPLISPLPLSHSPLTHTHTNTQFLTPSQLSLSLSLLPMKSYHNITTLCRFRPSSAREVASEGSLWSF